MASMIEFWDYLLQFVVSAIGCVMASVLYAKMRRQPYFLLACFFGVTKLSWGFPNFNGVCPWGII